MKHILLNTEVYSHWGCAFSRNGSLEEQENVLHLEQAPLKDHKLMFFFVLICLLFWFYSNNYVIKISRNLDFGVYWFLHGYIYLLISLDLCSSLVLAECHTDTFVEKSVLSPLEHSKGSH